jgi:hypothetical protein
VFCGSGSGSREAELMGRVTTMNSLSHAPAPSWAEERCSGPGRGPRGESASDSRSSQLLVSRQFRASAVRAQSGIHGKTLLVESS